MSQMLPLLLDWLSVTPDPDLGLLGLRNLALQPHHRSRLVTTFREIPRSSQTTLSAPRIEHDAR